MGVACESDRPKFWLGLAETMTHLFDVQPMRLACWSRARWVQTATADFSWRGGWCLGCGRVRRVHDVGGPLVCELASRRSDKDGVCQFGCAGTGPLNPFQPALSRPLTSVSSHTTGCHLPSHFHSQFQSPTSCWQPWQKNGTHGSLSAYIIAWPVPAGLNSTWKSH